MKPERIQFAPTTTGPAWGVFQTFRFGSFRKAVSFSDFVSEMGDNHGVEVNCSIDSHVNELVILVRADGVGEVDDAGQVQLVGETDGARNFLLEVADIFGRWGSPATVS
jgi:hypothetical protein